MDGQTKIAQLKYLIEHLAEAEGSRDADCGYVTGKHFQMMTMCPDPDGLAAAINTLPAICSDLQIMGEALERIATVDMGGGFLGAQACRKVAQDALAKAKGGAK